MSTVDLPPPTVGPLSRLAPKPVRFVLNWGRRYSLWVFNFGLACCAIEFIATSMSRHDFIRLGVIPFAPGPRQADLMVVSGTVSDKMAPAVRRLYEQMPEPKYVISFGACSNCGGPYWDSYCVTKGVDQIVPVDVYVPGCPPRPEALLHGIVRLQEKIAGESLGDRYGGDGEPVAPAPPPRPLSATVLRRPLQPPPSEDDVPTVGFAPVPEDEAGTGPGQSAEPADSTRAEDGAAASAEPGEAVPQPLESPEPAGPVEPAGPAEPTGHAVETARRPAEDAPEPGSPAAAPTERPSDQPEPPEPTDDAHRPGGPAHETQPVTPVDEPRPPAGPDDATVPVEPVAEPESRSEPAPEPAPGSEPEPRSGSEAETEPQTGQERPEARPPAGGRAKRRRRPRWADHDPSIIPGLVDDEPGDEPGDGHDDEPGRTAR